MRRVAAGDATALGALHERWAPLVHGLALRLLGDAEEAAIVVEETFWQAWRQAPRHADARATVATWLTTVAHRRALHHLHARRRARGEPGPAAPDAVAAHQPLDTGDERQGRAAAAFEALAPPTREAIALAYFDGRALSEIAPRTGEPPEAVAARIRRGLERLRAELASERGG